uniref:Uncharacterized protein n=1 Tax=Paraburkholderia sprentiae WSM5005 TaxID=754502 RepID=A0A1I9YU72_9BURK
MQRFGTLRDIETTNNSTAAAFFVRLRISAPEVVNIKCGYIPIRIVVSSDVIRPIRFLRARFAYRKYSDTG